MVAALFVVGADFHVHSTTPRGSREISFPTMSARSDESLFPGLWGKRPAPGGRRGP